LCENINAEICGGTIASTIEAVGYLTWTFYARRVKANPSYYGAESRSDEHVELHLLRIAKATLESLYDSGCITYSKDDDDATITANPLGLASSNYYLTYRTPKQMQLGVRNARKMVLKAIGDFGNSPGATAGASFGRGSPVLMPLIRHERVDEISCALLLYTLCSTHECNELPVRHNEEQLNMELSEQLMWGPDTQVLHAENGRRVHYNDAIFEDPHTKAFLLMQAYLQHARLPISDYVNDTKSIVDNVPRLLAAMEFIALDDASVAGSFELVTQFARVRQLFETRTIVHDSPLVQLELKRDVIDSMMKSIANKNRKDAAAVPTIAALRALPRKDALSLLQKWSNACRKGNSSNDQHPFRSALDKLYSIPLFTLKSAVVVQDDVETTTGKKATGKLKLCLEIERGQANNNNRGTSSSSSERSNQNEHHPPQQPFQVDLLLGSHPQRMILAKSTLTISRFGKWTVNKELSFDWNNASAKNTNGGGGGGGVAEGDGGKGNNVVVLRLLLDKCRGFDLETVIALA
jgi:Sec63 Brl domain